LIDLSKLDRSRQNSIWVDGIEYKIKISFPYWISFSKKFEGLYREGVKEFSLLDLDYLYELTPPENRKAGYEELFKFYQNEQPLPHYTKEVNVRNIDWIIDSEYIYSAFLQLYGINLIKQDIHWHDFLSLFNSLTGTKLNDIISARYIKDEKGTTKGMKELREAWKLETPEVERAVFKMR